MGVVGLCAAFMIVLTGCTKHGKGGASGLRLFGISLQKPTEVTSRNLADPTFLDLEWHSKTFNGCPDGVR